MGDFPQMTVDILGPAVRRLRPTSLRAGRSTAGLYLALGIIVLLSCDSSSPEPDPSVPVPTKITVTPASSTLAALGWTVQMSTVVLDARGNVVPKAQVS